MLGPPSSSANDHPPAEDDLAAAEDPEADEDPVEPDPGVPAEPDTVPPGDEEPQPGDEPDGEPDPDGAPAEARIDPGTISVQVLDGYQLDGGTAASAITSQLRDAGYQIIAENPAIAYERTTVLWTPGFEAEARQVAEEIGAAEVREQPGNLSTQVAVHVVVGADRG